MALHAGLSHALVWPGARPVESPEGVKMGSTRCMSTAQKVLSLMLPCLDHGVVGHHMLAACLQTVTPVCGSPFHKHRHHNVSLTAMRFMTPALGSACLCISRLWKVPLCPAFLRPFLYIFAFFAADISLFAQFIFAVVRRCCPVAVNLFDALLAGASCWFQSLGCQPPSNKCASSLAVCYS